MSKSDKKIDDEAPGTSMAHEAILTKINAVDRKLNRILALLGEKPKEVGAPVEDMALLYGLTMKQHVALQLIVNGASNRKIGEVLGVSENGAKVHVRTIASKLSVATRAQITARMLPALREISDKDYLKVSKGLPKDWAVRFAEAEEDPYREQYQS